MQECCKKKGLRWEAQTGMSFHDTQERTESAGRDVVDEVVISQRMDNGSGFDMATWDTLSHLKETWGSRPVRDDLSIRTFKGISDEE